MSSNKHLELSRKHLGLYLCLDGKFIPALAEAHRLCLERGDELEIVVVCIPLFDDQPTYNAYLTRASDCSGCSNIKSWFMFRLEGNNSKVCRRLWRVLAHQGIKDMLTILPPADNSSRLLGEIDARTIIDKWGKDQYPFTRSEIYKHRFCVLNSYSPLSWFTVNPGDVETCLVRPNEEGVFSVVPLSEIAGKKLLLYIDRIWSYQCRGSLSKLLKDCYRRIQDAGWEVVFVPLDDKEEDDSDGDDYVYQPNKMPWPNMPIEHALKASIPKKLTFGGEGYEICQLIAVGDNGKILSRKAAANLMWECRFADPLPAADLLFADELLKELRLV